ncbi:MAG TPA: tRNA (guanine(10)-N(2))-dimethyltransferase [Candidatus Acidoferrum sp.]|nr:tRNA (guanine(10)-N(2))-dimethyltransferase [Candidatus Acidoferrum sp.]
MLKKPCLKIFEGNESMAEVLSSLSFPTEMIVEGEARLLVPKLRAFVKSPSDYAPSKAPVFYNPVMELNRDIAVLALQAYQRMVDHQISVCEPLASSGIRGVRFAVEIQNVKQVIMNDINKNAVQIATYNAQINEIGDKTVVENKDANLLLTEHAMPHNRFDAVDLDPFGSPVTYLDSAIRALRDHGLLALTATDMAPLCGVHPRACIRKYGGRPLRTEYCHELAVRLLAGSLATEAAKHDIGLQVLFSHAAEHYIRVYALMEYGAKLADESLNKMGFILHCFKCFHRESLVKPYALEGSGKCPECGSKLTVGGPLWLGKLLDEDFCQLMENEIKHKNLRKKEKIRKILALAKNEATAPIGYYVVDRLCDTLNLPVPSVQSVAETLKKEGFQTCLTRFNSKGIRSNASAAEMKELVKKLVKINQ